MVADDSDLEEVYNTERHLLYVACTRARDHLLGHRRGYGIGVPRRSSLGSKAGISVFRSSPPVNILPLSTVESGEKWLYQTFFDAMPYSCSA